MMCGSVHAQDTLAKDGIAWLNMGPLCQYTPLAHLLMRMQAVRAVFNIAIGADSADLQRTARSALLQMLNTVVKRITMATVVRAAPNMQHR